MTTPPCQHRGRVVNNDTAFCHHPHRPDTVTADDCHGCPFVDQVDQAAADIAPECPHRRAPIAAIVSTCPKSDRRPVFDCTRHGPCVLTLRDREDVPRVACCATCSDRPVHPTRQTEQAAPVDVIVTTHNYARYLQDCLRSIESQTARPASVVVVDDASSDGPRDQVDQFPGVHYLRTEYRSPAAARYAGLQLGTAPFVLFVDADNMLPPDYIAAGLRVLNSNPAAAITYADLQFVGDSDARYTFPDQATADTIARDNVIDTCSLVRRQALETVPPTYWTRPRSLTPEDHALWPHILRDGWHAQKHDVPLLYRHHSDQWTAHRGRLGTYADTHGIFESEQTLFIPLSGRRWALPSLSEFLRVQTFPHHLLRIIVCDSSQDPAFSRDVRAFLADCDYADVRHFRFAAARPGLSDENRHHRPTEREVQLACSRIYNRLRRSLETDYVWILEDDIRPPDDALPRMLSHFAPDVAAVTAIYHSRHDGRPVIFASDPIPNGGARHVTPPPPHAPQITPYRSSGFGCVVIRSEVLKARPFGLPPDHLWYDPAFFAQIGDQWRRLADWTIQCQHLTAPAPAHQAPPCSSTPTPAKFSASSMATPSTA